MKKTVSAWMAALCLLPWLAQAQYLEGIEYAQIKNPQPVETGKKIEVRELFWYGCPHCYTLEPTLEKWLKNIPPKAEFVRMPAVMNPPWEVHARAYYAFEALGVTAKLHKPFFDAIHQAKRNLNDLDSIADFVGEHGVDKKKFRDAFKSFSVDANVKNATQLGQRYGATSVPTMIVDGKYLTNGSMAGGYGPMLKVVEYLIDKAAKERGSSTAKSH